MIYALIMCTSVGQPYTSCFVYPQSAPMVYQTLGECRFYEGPLKQAFSTTSTVTVECRGKKVAQWEVIKR
jgi:hypothetical protein